MVYGGRKESNVAVRALVNCTVSPLEIAGGQVNVLNVCVCTSAVEHTRALARGSAALYFVRYPCTIVRRNWCAML